MMHYPGAPLAHCSALVAAAFLPGLASVVWTTRELAPDLFDLTPVVARWDQYSILAWPELQWGRRSRKWLRVRARRVLGYGFRSDRRLRT